jgi:hypothetical protein
LYNFRFEYCRYSLIFGVFSDSLSNKSKSKLNSCPLSIKWHVLIAVLSIKWRGIKLYKRPSEPLLNIHGLFLIFVFVFFLVVVVFIVFLFILFFFQIIRKEFLPTKLIRHFEKIRVVFVGISNLP